MSLLNSANAIYLGAQAVDRVYAGSVQVWPYQVLVGDGALHPAATFSRLSAGAYFDAAPLMQTAAAGVPRWDHDPLTGAALGLLIEQQSTNIFMRSAVFDIGGWGTYPLVFRAAISTAPDGSIPQHVAAGTPAVSQEMHDPPVPNTGTYAQSAYMRAAEYSYGRFQSWDGAVDSNMAISLTSGAVTASVGSGATKQVAGGWWRAKQVMARAVDAGGYFGLGVSNVMGARVYAGDGTSGIDMWGAQLEVGPVATSYIATNGAAATRAEDVLTYPAPGAAGTILLDHDAAAAASLINTNSTDVLTSQGLGKIAIAWDASGTSVCYNGGAVTTGAAITWGSDFRLLKNANAHIKPNGAKLYPRKLSDAELQAATA